MVDARWEPSGKLSFPQCCNLPIQGAAADAMLRALALTYSRLRAARIRGGIVASIHDEIVLEVDEDDAALAGVGLTRVLSYQAARAVRDSELRLVLEKFEPAPLPVSLMHAGGDPLPLKVRSFLDFAAPRLRKALGALEGAL